MIVGRRVTPEIKQTASFLGSKGIDVTCVEFTFFKAAGGGRLLSQEIVVGGEHARPRRVVSGSLPAVSEVAVGSLGDPGFLDGRAAELSSRMTGCARGGSSSSPGVAVGMAVS